MEIANVEAALEKVRAFIAVLDRNERLWESDSTGHPAWRQNESQIHQEFPLILRIADRIDPDLAAMLKKEGYGWRYRPAMEAARQLAGLLDTAEEAERILGPAGAAWDNTDAPVPRGRGGERGCLDLRENPIGTCKC